MASILTKETSSGAYSPAELPASAEKHLRACSIEET